MEANLHGFALQSIPEAQLVLLQPHTMAELGDHRYTLCDLEQIEARRLARRV